MDLPVRQWLHAASLDEAVALLDANPHARAVAGGTDLVVQLRDGRMSAEALVDLSHLGLSGIHERDGGLEIGASVLDKTYPLQDAAAAQERLWRNENFGKITLEIS